MAICVYGFDEMIVLVWRNALVASQSISNNKRRSVSIEGFDQEGSSFNTKTKTVICSLRLSYSYSSVASNYY